jgi:hypothetical protein
MATANARIRQAIAIQTCQRRANKSWTKDQSKHERHARAHDSEATHFTTFLTGE